VKKVKEKQVLGEKRMTVERSREKLLMLSIIPTGFQKKREGV